MKEGIKKAEEVLRKGYHIAILPEGTRTLTGKLGKLKKDYVDRIKYELEILSDLNFGKKV